MKFRLSNKSQLNDRISDDFYYCIFIVGIFLVKVFGYFWVESFGDSAAFQTLSKVVQAILLLMVILPLIKKRRYVLLMAECVLLIMYGVSFGLGYASNSLLLNGIFYGAVVYIPMAIAANSIQDKKLLIRYFYRGVWIASILLLIAVYMKVFVRGDTVYDMTLGYYLVLPILFYIERYLRRLNVIDLIMAIFECVVIVFFGSRGPFICIIGGILLLILFSKESRGRRRSIFSFVFLAIAVVLVAFWNWILEGMENLINVLGITSRSIQLLLEGNALFYTSGRDNILSDSIGLLNQHPIFGVGVMGGQGVFGKGLYPHNIFVELLQSFGYPIGICACVLVIVLMVRGLLLKETNSREISIIFIAYCLMLMVSGTFLDSWQFFVFIGLSLSGPCVIKLKTPRWRNNFRDPVSIGINQEKETDNLTE